MVAVAADPYHEQLGDVRHFIAVRGLSHVPNFYFVTGPLPAVRKVWAAYGVGVSMTKADIMSIHSDYMFIIDAKHQVRWIIPDDPIASSSGSASAVSELRALLADEGVH
jgi:cytochrome oxidase Cu insertion factor (SCO1/SenC/PrrC family)